MRKWISKIHLYGMLLCSSYLIIFGISSLNFNHRFVDNNQEKKKVYWERSLDLQNIEDNNVFSVAVRDSLGLMGWTPPWEAYRDSLNNLHFGITRPGKRYKISVLTQQNLVKVEEKRAGYLEIIMHLHALNKIPKSIFIDFWGIYLNVSTLIIIFCAISGVYLWISRRSERLTGLIILGLSVISSLILMLYTWLIG